ncbi:hypothetical protein [uncultured Dysosmobacter sp.]|uniref:hypothetical protein n=1 Tax=uncultured Dysosmobacter sp. TaxID=2591384 RepID=UPI0026288041|nr:hypothetical protein [uncultured Dysosmobacter sp.]
MERHHRHPLLVSETAGPGDLESPGAGDQRAVEMELPYLRTTLESVRRLRRFLGYSGETKWEREARCLLELENTP